MPGEADPALEALAKQRGTDLHLLLEHLPDFPEADWPAVAGALVAVGLALLLRGSGGGRSGSAAAQGEIATIVGKPDQQ
jgi:hypothetical protein